MRDPAAPVALLLVRNPFVNDARVLRAARLLRDLGAQPRVVAVMSARVRRRHGEADGIPVLRLDPTSPLALVRRALRRGGGGREGGGSPSRAAPAAGRALPGAAVRLHRLLRTLDFYRRAIGVVRRERPAVLHCNDYNTMWVGVVARGLGVKVLYDAHEIWPDRNGRPEPRWWLLLCEALFVRVAHAVVTASPAYADVMARRYRVPPPVVVLNVPERTADAAPEPGPPLAIYLGGLLRHRGLEQCLEAVARVPEVRLRAIGPAGEAYVQELRDLAGRLGVADRFEVRPPVAPDEVVAAAAGAHVGLALFQPTCLSHELVAPNKLFEYIAAGVPVLGTDLPVIREVVRRRGVGRVVPAGDVDALAGGLRALLDPAEQARCRAAAREAARELTWAVERRGLAGVYERLLAIA